MRFLRKSRNGKEVLMTKKGKKDKVEEMCVIFVEGDADELIINRLLDYYKDNGWSRPKGIRVFNTHGTPIWRNMRVGLVGIQQSMDIPMHFRAICCEFDTDVYVKGIQTEPNWKEVEKLLKKEFGVREFCCLRAETSIENWMLDDTEGVLNALGLPKNTKIKGTSGQNKMENLFLQKGSSYFRNKGAEKIKLLIDKLDIDKIRKARIKELEDFEKMLKVTIK